MKTLGICLLFTGLTFCANAQPTYRAPQTEKPPTIDGYDDEPSWSLAPWRDLDQLIVGQLPKAEDFSGRYKVIWDREHLYLLAEVTDDALVDGHPDPLDHYWDDDCLEIFIDADQSGGDHTYSHNAFAYHLALDGNVVDLGTDQKPRLYKGHVHHQWRRHSSEPGKVIWEAAIKIYDDRYRDDHAPPEPVKLRQGMQMGWMVAYCDADLSGKREHFMGDTAIEPVNGDRNLAWRDADVFGQLLLFSP